MIPRDRGADRTPNADGEYRLQGLWLAACDGEAEASCTGALGLALEKARPARTLRDHRHQWRGDHPFRGNDSAQFDPPLAPLGATDADKSQPTTSGASTTSFAQTSAPKTRCNHLPQSR
jgi:hypothetical protein